MSKRPLDGQTSKVGVKSVSEPTVQSDQNASKRTKLTNDRPTTSKSNSNNKVQNNAKTPPSSVPTSVRKASNDVDGNIASTKALVQPVIVLDEESERLRRKPAFKRRAFSKTYGRYADDDKVWNETPTLSEYLETLSEMRSDSLLERNPSDLAELDDKLRTRVELRPKLVAKYDVDHNPLFLKNVHSCELPTSAQVENRLGSIVDFLQRNETETDPNLTADYIDRWTFDRTNREDKFQQFYESFHPNRSNVWNTICELSVNDLDTFSRLTENPVSVRYSCAIDSVLFCLMSCLEFRDLIVPYRDRKAKESEKVGSQSGDVTEEMDERINESSDDPAVPSSVLKSSFCEGSTSSDLTRLPAILKMSLPVSGLAPDVRLYARKVTEEMFNMTMGFYGRYAFGFDTNPRKGRSYNNNNNNNNNGTQKHFEGSYTVDWNAFEDEKKGFLMFHHFLARQLSDTESPEVFCPGESVTASAWNPESEEPKATVLRNITEGCNYWDGLMNMLRFTYSSLGSGYHLPCEPAAKKNPFAFDRFKVEDDSKNYRRLHKENLQKMVILSQLRYAFLNFYFGNLRKEQIVHWGAGHQASTSSETRFKSANCAIASVLPSHDPVCLADFDVSFLGQSKSEFDFSRPTLVQKAGHSCVRLIFDSMLSPNGKIPTVKTKRKQLSAHGETCADRTETLKEAVRIASLLDHQRIFGLKHKDHLPLKTEDVRDSSKIDINVPTATSLYVDVIPNTALTFDWHKLSIEEALEWEKTPKAMSENTPLRFQTKYTTARGEDKHFPCFVISAFFLNRRINDYSVLSDSFCVTVDSPHIASYSVDPLVHRREEKFERPDGTVAIKVVTKVYQPVSVIIRKKENHFAAHGLLSKQYGRPENEENWENRSKPVAKEGSDGENDDRLRFKEDSLSSVSLIKGWHYDDLLNLGNAVRWNELNRTTSGPIDDSIDPLVECVLKQNFVTLGCDEVMKPKTHGDKHCALDDPNKCYRVGRYDLKTKEGIEYDRTYHLIVKNPLVSLASVFYVLRGEHWTETEV